MCLAIPGKVIKVEGSTAVIQYPKETRTAKIIGEPVSAGDYVLVQAGIVLDKIPEEQAKKALEAWSRIK